MSIEKEKPLYEGIDEENLSIEVTTECNSKCTYCFARAGLKELTSLSPETTAKIIEEGYNLGYRYLHITGGEPLLWQPLHSFLDSAVETGFKSIFCNTNGTLLTKEKCSSLKHYGDKITISVSLQGNKNLHDRIRGRGSWDRVKTGLNNALEAGISTVIFSTVGKSLIPGLPEFADSLFKEYPDIKQLTLIQLIRVAGDIFDLSSELLSTDDFIRMIQAASMLNIYGIPVNILENPLACATADMLGMNWIPQAPPPHRTGRVVIMANRHITISHSSRDTLGIYKPGELERVLRSDEYREAASPDTVTCPLCLYYDLCIKHNMIRPSEWYRDMNTGIPFCKRVLDKSSELCAFNRNTHNSKSF